MAQSCTYTFNGPDGKEVTIRGMAAMKAYLVDGGMEFFQTKGVRFEGLEKAEAKPAEQIGVLSAVSIPSISLRSSESAFGGQSHNPERRGRDFVNGFRQDLINLAKQFEKQYEAATPDQQRSFVDTFNAIAEQYAKSAGSYLSANSRVMSAMVTGSGNFPFRSNEKKADIADKRGREMMELLEGAPKRLQKAIRGPVDDSPQSELQHAQAKLAEREAAQETMKKANALLRKNDDAGLRALGFSDEQIAELKKPDFAGRVGFPNYRLTNNNAEIRRLRGRVEELQSRVERVETEETPKERTIGPGRIVENVAENRVQIFFDGKPSEEVRNALKSAAFRWAPSAGAWQRQLTPNAVYAAEQALKPFAGDTPSVLRATDADTSNQRITRAQADGFLSGFLAKYANAPQITLVNTFDQLPATVQQEARNQGGNASDTKGVFHRGQVYLVAGNHSTVADLEATVFHEVIGHAGVRALFGDDFVKTANRLFMQLGGQAGLVKIMQKRGMGQQASDYIKGIAQAQRNELNQIRADMAAGKPGAQRRWNDTIARFVLTEEVYAHIAEQVTDRPSMMDKMKELIGKVRQWLRDKGFAELPNLGETDILFTLSKARQNMQGKDGNITRNGVTVSGNDLMTSDGRRLNKDDPDYASAMRLADLLGLRQEQGVTTFRSDPEGDTPAVLSRAPSATQQQGKGRIGAAVDSFLNGRNDMPEWLAQMPAETQEAARKAGIWTQQKPLAERLKDIRQNALKRLQQGLLDQFAPLKELGEREYVLARLTKSADAPLESLLLYGRPFMNDAGAIDVNLENGGLIGALQDLNGEHDRFFAWIAGNRAEQLKKEGRENLFTDTDISALKDMNDGTMADGRSRKAVYESMLLKFNSYSKSVLDIAEKAGIIAKEDRAIWEKDFYVPFYRAMEDGEYKGPKTASGLVNQYAFKKLQGGTDNLNDLMQNTLRNWSHLLSASLKNQAAAAALSSAEKAGVAVPVSQKQKGSVSYLGRVKRKIPQGQTYTENGVQKVSDGTAEIETIGEKHFMVEDPFILDAITSLEWAGWNNPAMKWMQRAKHYLTLGVTISPTFKIRNLIRDQIAAIGLNPMSYNMMQNLSQGWKGTDKDSAEYAKMLAGGGLMRFGTFLEDDRAQHMKRLIDAGVADDTILTSSEKVKSALGKAWDWWQEVGDRSENIARAAIYKQRFDQLVKEGKTQDEAHLLASFAARDSMDFSLQGQWGSIRFLTQLVPFLNARLQGLYKLGRDGVAPTVRLVTGNAEMGDKERAQRFGAVVGTVAFASIALMLAYEDDEDWKNREEWDRDTYWWFKVGDTAYRIPKPFEIGAIGTLAERGLETAMNGFDKESRRIFVERLGAMLTGTFAMNPVPQLFKPLIDLYANTDSFTGRPIETMGMERLSKSERIGVNTSATAQLIGKATSLVGLSPVQVDHLIDGYFSWLGTHLAMTADFALRPMMGLPDQPARKWPDGYFVVGDFAKDLPANQSRYLTQFYEQSKKVQEAMADIRYYQNLGMTEKAMKLSQENKDEIQLYKTYSAAQRQIGEINKHIRMVQMSGKDAAVKRDEIDRLTQARNKIAELTETRRAALQ